MVYEKKILLFEEKNIKLLNKRYFVENKRNNVACLKNAVNLLVA
jgi:hypothetical protein